jgi:hypothetical protein
MVTTKHQHRQQARALASRMKRFAEQVLADLDHDRASLADPRQSAVIGVELGWHLQAICLTEDLATRMRGEEEPAA